MHVSLSDRNLTLDFVSHSFEYTVKKQGWMGGGTRSVKFAHGTTSTPMVRSMIGLRDRKRKTRIL